MIKNKIKKCLFCLTTILTISMFFDVQTQAAIDMTDWEIEIEKNIVNDYKIKADEKNVEFMKDRDSKVSDVVENIKIEGSTKNAEEVEKDMPEFEPLYIQDFEEEKEALIEYWGNLLYSYSVATGYIKGNYNQLKSNTELKGYGYDFYLSNTDINKDFSDFLTWSENKYDEINEVIIPIAEKIKAMGDNCEIEIEFQFTTDVFNSYFTYILKYDDKYISESRKIRVGSNTEIHPDAMKKIQANIKEVITKDNYKLLREVVKSHYEKQMTNYTNCYVNEHLYENVDDYFHSTYFPSEKLEIDFGKTYTKKIKIKTQDRSIELKKDASVVENMSSWAFIPYTDISYRVDKENIDMATQKMIEAGMSDVYVHARIKCLSIFIKSYNDYYIERFAEGIASASESVKLKLLNHSYLNRTKYRGDRKIQYEGASFSTENLNDSYYYIGRSGFYYNGHCLNLKDSYGIDALSIENAVKNGIFTGGDKKLKENLLVFFFSSGDKITKKHENGADYAKDIKTSLDEYWIEPIPFEIVFDDTSVEYTKFLTTSCIVNNPLDRYEFWGQNASNELDTTYYGEMVELLPNEINKDGYLYKNAHTVKLNPNENWGIYLFARYKYVNYIYKIYYGFYGKQPQMIVELYPEQLKYQSGKDVAKTLGLITCRKLEDNEFGWFWRFTYSKRESANGRKENKYDYYVTRDIALEQEKLIKERLMQNVEEDNDIMWLRREHIDEKHEYNNGNIGLPYGFSTYNNTKIKNNDSVFFGDLYAYKNAVRAETLYYQVNVPFSVNEGERTASDYILALGDNEDNSFECGEAEILCDCEKEIGKCDQDTDTLIMTATVTN